MNFGTMTEGGGPPGADQEMNLRGKLGQQIDFMFEVLKEMNSVSERIASKTHGWSKPPVDVAEKEKAGCPPGFMNEFIDRLKMAEKRARVTLAILHEADNQF